MAAGGARSGSRRVPARRSRTRARDRSCTDMVLAPLQCNPVKGSDPLIRRRSRGLTLAAIAGLLVALANALVIASLTNNNPRYVARSVLIFAVAAVMIVRQARAHFRAPRFGAANTVTLVRVALA